MYATTNYGFETTDLSENEVDQIWQNINLRKSSDLKSLDSIELPIVSFISIIFFIAPSPLQILYGVICDICN